MESNPNDSTSPAAEVKDKTTQGAIAETKSGETDIAKAQDQLISTNDSEILKAIAYGFVPKELQRDWSSQITFTEYCTMISRLR